MNEQDRFRFFVRPAAKAAARDGLPGATGTPSMLSRYAEPCAAPLPAAAVCVAAEASGTTVSAATWPPARASRHASDGAGPVGGGSALAGRSPAAVPARRPKRRHLRLVTKLEQHRGDDDGFSLLELLVVVAILGILVAAALPRFAEFRAAAYDSRSQQDLRNLAAAEELFRATSPTYADDTALLTGFQASEGVEVALESADETGFVATATHPAGARDFRWDSSADPPLSSVAR
jgi:type IV pilus assembly protein PilA